MKKAALLYFLFAFAWPASSVHADAQAPVYLSLSQSPHDFELFANGGWDGNWYVGYNSMWIVKLKSPSSETRWQKAFIGARLGRMKSRKVEGRPPWIMEAIPCEIYMGISSTSSWRVSDSYFLTTCEDIPLDGSTEDAIRGVGESQWFWREIRLRDLNFEGDNYLAIWSPTESMTASGVAPIIAATSVKGKVAGWLNRTIKGGPPSRSEGSLETQLSAFAPSLALKLIPAPSTGTVDVSLLNFKDGLKLLEWSVQVNAKNFDRVQPEISVNGKNWIPFGRVLSKPPFTVAITRDRIKSEAARIIPNRKRLRQVYIRITAWDEWENSGSTPQFLVYIRS